MGMKMDQVVLVPNNSPGPTEGECESSLGPMVGYCGGRIDFTLLFEQCFFSILPSALFLLSVPLRLLQLKCQSRKVDGSTLLFLKLVACVLFGALQLRILLFWATASRLHDESPLLWRVSVAASALGVADAMGLGVLSHREHGRSIRPSSVISVYLFFSVLLDAVQFRTLWLIGNAQSLAPIFTAMVASRFAMFILETRPKHRGLMSKWELAGPEATSGIINRSLFWWLNSFLVRGFRGKIDVSTFGLDRELSSETRFNVQRQQWHLHQGTKEQHALLWALIHSVEGAFLACVPPRLFLIAFKVMQPLLINRIILYMGESRTKENILNGYVLIGATGLLYGGLAIIEAIFLHKRNRLSTVVRGSLVSLVLHETSDLGATEEGAATLTLISTDVDRISKSVESIHDIWGGIVELILAVWLLTTQLGLGSIGPLLLVFVTYFLTRWTSKQMGPAQLMWTKAIQTRVTSTSKIVGSMKEVKMLGVVGSWLERIQGLMDLEVSQAKAFRTLMVYVTVAGNIPNALTPTLCFAIAIAATHLGLGLSGSLSLSVMFTSGAIMELISGPLAMLIYAIPNVARSLPCIDRLQDFLIKVGQSRDLRGEAARESSSFTYCDDVEVTQDQNYNVPVMSVENASFSYKIDGDPTLRDINMSVPVASFTAIVGKVGTGKTTLLQALLGELHTTGSLKRSCKGGIAYCGQSPWLVNLTIRQNILGQSQMENDWYDTVIRACALDRDFADLPSGDLSVIGTKGISLSGGQRHRVALARAVYSRKRLLVIDDVFSGLDWSTQSHIWNRVLGPDGLARTHGLTVILATHHLKDVRDADQIIVLGDEGRIICQGTFEQINQNDQFTRLHSNISESSSSSTVEEDEGNIDAPVEKARTTATTGRDELQAFDRDAGDSSLYVYYFKHVGRKYLTLSFLAGVTPSLLAIASQLWIKIWAEKNETQPDVNTGFYLGVYAALAVGVLVGTGIDVWVIFTKVILRATRGVHRALVQAVMRAPLSFFVATDTGDVMNRFSKDIGFVDSNLPYEFIMTWHAIRGAVVSAILVLPGSSYLAATVPLIILFLYGLQKYYMATSRQLRFCDLQAAAPLNTHLLETVDGLATIRAFGWRDAYRKASLELLDASQRPHYLLLCVQRWLGLVLNLFVAGLAMILVALGVFVPGGSTVGFMALAITNMLGLGRSLVLLVASWTSLETSLGALSRIRDFEANTPREPVPANPEKPPHRWPSNGEIELREVTASYNTTADPVLNQISLTIKKGEKLAICGRTGSGKSSLLLTLFRLLDLDTGSITVDGMDISHIPQNEVRRRLISVPQEPTIFPGTVRSNLWLPDGDDSDGNPCPTDEQMQTALELVELWDVISTQGDNGFDTDMATVTLSLGQKQLFCLCRAVLRRETSAVLVLDEAMGAVDGQTESVMVRVLETEFAQHTVISVAHRLNTVRKFDRVVVLDKGRVVEVGEPNALLDKVDGRFRALWNRQG